MNVSRVQASGGIENREASTGDLPKQGSGPQRDLRDEGILAQVFSIIYEECDRQEVASNEAQRQLRPADMYRHNTALRALWAIAAKIGALAKAKEEHASGAVASDSERVANTSLKQDHP